MTAVVDEETNLLIGDKNSTKSLKSHREKLCRCVSYPFLSMWEWKSSITNDFGAGFLVLVAVIYFVQGTNIFMDRLQAYFYRNDLGQDPSSIQMLNSITKIPSFGKTFWGLLVDNVPIFGLHAKPWLTIAALFGITANLVVGLGLVSEVALASTFFFMFNLSVALSFVVIDKFIVVNARNQEGQSGAAILQSWSWFWMFAGRGIGSGVGGYLSQNLANPTIFLIFATCPATVLLVIHLLAETKSGVKFSCTSILEQLRIVTSALSTREVWLPMLFVFISGCLSPTVKDLRTFWGIEVGRTDKEWLGIVDVCSNICGLFGVVMYSKFFKGLTFRTSFGICKFFTALVVLNDLVMLYGYNEVVGIPTRWYYLFGDCLTALTTAMSTLPLVVLCAQLSPPKVEATFFSSLMVVTNLSGAVADLFGGTVSKLLGICSHNSITNKVDYSNLPYAVIIRSVLIFSTLTLLWMLPNTNCVDIYAKHAKEDKAKSTQSEKTRLLSSPDVG